MTTEFTRELAQIAEEQRRRAESNNRKAQVERVKQERLEADELVKDDVGTLKDRMREAAERGERSLSLVSSYYGHFSRRERLLAKGYLQWAVREGVDTYWEEHGPSGSDDYTDGSEHFGLRW